MCDTWPHMLRAPLVVTFLVAVSGVAAGQPSSTRSTPARVDATTDLVVEYQRVGHEIVMLQNRRGRETTADLWADLHTIDLDKGLVTADGRANAAITLAELHDKIERRRGIEISKACQNSVIAVSCE